MDEANRKSHAPINNEIQEELKEIYKDTFEQLSMMSSYSKYKPSFVPPLQRLGASCSYLWCKLFSCNRSEETQTSFIKKKRGIKIEHLKIWCEDKYLGPDLTSGFVCAFDDDDVGHETDYMMNKCKGGRMPVGRDTSCVRELFNRHYLLNNLIDEADIDKDGILSEDEFYGLMLNIHLACRCTHSCVPLIDTVPKNSKWRKLGSAGTMICWPPPLFIIFVTLLQIVVFCVQTWKTVSRNGITTPMCSEWVLNPERRFVDPWRFLTYAFIHKDVWHLMSNVIGQLVLGFSLECSDTANHSTLRVALIYFSGIIFGAIGRINPITLEIPRTPLVGASGGLYALFGAHIAHVILNWEEDKLVFRGTCILNVSGKNVLKPLPKKYAIKFRMLRLFILIAWVIAEGCLGFYNKVAKCRKPGESRDLNDFDDVEDNLLESYLEQPTLKQTGFCSSHASYSAHFFGFVSGLLVGLVVLKRRGSVPCAVKVVFRMLIMFIFFSVVFYLVYRNHQSTIANSGYHGSFQVNCTGADYEKMCQAKCYCGWKQSMLREKMFYENCKNFTICNERKTQKFSYSTICTDL